jgi:hypothetical protein
VLSVSDKLYTVAEANAILPEVRHIVERMLAARTEIVEHQPELWAAVQAAVWNGGGKRVSAATRQIVIIQDAIRILQAHNILVKDINTGLLDFPAERNGQLVLLCWQYDEPSVLFWHDVDQGFAGRQRIDETFD